MPRSQRLKSTIYIGREPYFHPPLSESAVVYGRLSSMQVVKKWVEDDGKPVPDIVRLGCGSTRDQLTAEYAIVVCGSLTEDEAAHISIAEGAGLTRSSSKSWNIKVAMGSGDIDVNLLPNQKLIAFAPDADGSGNNMFLTIGENKQEASNHRHGPRRTVRNINHCSCQPSSSRFFEISDDIYESLSFENARLEAAHHNQSRRSSNHDNHTNGGHDHNIDSQRRSRRDNATGQALGHQKDPHPKDHSQKDHSQKDDNPKDRHQEDHRQEDHRQEDHHQKDHHQESSTIKHSDVFQQIITRASIKLEAAYYIWMLKAVDSEVAGLMFEEIERLRTASSQGGISYAIAPLDMQLNLWKISVEGPAHTPYKDGIFELEVDIGTKWQNIEQFGKSIKCISDIDGCGLRILTSIIHPDITKEGKARNLESMFALNGFNLDIIAKSFIEMLNYPERVPKYLAAKPELAELAKDHPDLFDTLVREWTQKHAMSGKSSESMGYGRLR